MKTLFTLIAFLAAVLGAKAEIVVDKTVDFSTYTAFPHNATTQMPEEWYPVLSTNPVQSIYKPFQPYEYEGASQEVIDGLVKNVEPQSIGGDSVYAYTAPAVDRSQYTTNKYGEDVSGNYARANQLFIVFAEPLKEGDIVRISFDYKADKTAKTNTEAHAAPTHFQHWEFIGDVTFTEEWQTCVRQVTISAPQAGPAGCYSVAFNLNPDQLEENTYYLKNIFVGKIKFEDGYFVAGANTTTGLDYDYDNAVEFVMDEENEECLVATIGVEDDRDSWVDQVMISTQRGDDRAFKSSTIKPSAKVTVSDPDEWMDFYNNANAEINLPTAGVWKIRINTECERISFEQLEGNKIKEPKEINPNPTVFTINAVEREYKADEAPEGYEFQKDDKGIDITGNECDNQFIIMANRPLSAGEETYIEFNYKAAKHARVETLCGGSEPGAYVHWSAIGSIGFDEEEQTLSQTFIIPEECGNDQQSLIFNMALNKEANVYEIYDVVWKLSDNTESLIDEEGTNNFYVKTGAGTDPVVYGNDDIDGSGITNRIATIAIDKSPASVAYNIIGQRVVNRFHGIVIKNGLKYITK